jgi:hypothetical protein
MSVCLCCCHVSLQKDWAVKCGKVAVASRKPCEDHQRPDTRGEEQAPHRPRISRLLLSPVLDNRQWTGCFSLIQSSDSLSSDVHSSMKSREPGQPPEFPSPRHVTFCTVEVSKLTNVQGTLVNVCFLGGLHSLHLSCYQLAASHVNSVLHMTMKPGRRIDFPVRL